MCDHLLPELTDLRAGPMLHSWVGFKVHIGRVEEALQLLHGQTAEDERHQHVRLPVALEDLGVLVGAARRTLHEVRSGSALRARHRKVADLNPKVGPAIS